MDTQNANTVNSKKNVKWMATAILTAFGASLCCITPVLVVLAGLGGVASTFSWLDPFSPYLTGITVMVLGFAWYQRLKPQTQEEIECACEEDEQPSFWQTKKFLGIVTVFVALMVAFPYYSGIFFSDSKANTIMVSENNVVNGTLGIEGMTCTGCEQSVNHVLTSRNGVIEATSSYESGNARIKFDRTKVSIDELAAALEEEVGYKVTRKEIGSNN